MKTLCLCLLLLARVAVGSETAYTALRVIGAQKGQDLLNHVVSVEGRGGSPQPGVWRVVVDDPSARGGIREFEIAHGKIISEHTPVRSSGGERSVVMDFQKLNLDSEGAFTIANQEAGKSKIGFDTVDYVLKSGRDQTAPVWHLQLTDSASGNMGTIRVAADDGKVLSRDGIENPARDENPPIHHRYPDDRPVEEIPPPPPPPPDENPPIHNAPSPQHVGHEIDKHIRRVGATLEEFFTGKRTLDRKFENED